ncbi:MAG: DNA primase [Blastocatellia bacterium AA13]|nr:MAG: DNA primase [Blastocatellia bacterium AA13]
MRLPQGFADDVRNQADIIRVVSDYVSLKKRGANYIARCPFHSEKTPSFNVHPAKGIYKCFGCGAGGAVFDFIMQIEGCSFPEAVKIVAEKSGIPVPAIQENEDYKRAARERDIVLRLNEWAAEFFTTSLLGAAGKRALEYLISRGVTDQTRNLMRLGYAPDSWDALGNYLRERGASQSEIELSGLVSVKEQGGHYDRFRGRLMFPIADSQNRVIAFGGRIINDGEPKYLNSPETPVYSKGRNLYGLAHSKNAIRQLGFAILVEGYLDCIIPFQEGIQNIVASLGTALTDGQVRLLRRYMEKPRVVVNFDPDSAGQAATMRSIDLFLAEGFRVDVLAMPTKEDPDEFVRSKGADAFRRILNAAQPYIDFVVQTAVARNDISKPAGKVGAINEILPHLTRMRDRVERAGYADQIADRLRIDSRVIREEIKRAATNRLSSLDQKKLRAAQDMTQAERQLIEIMLLNEEVRGSILANIGEEDYADLATEAVFSAIIEAAAAGSELTYASLSEKIEGEAERTLLSGLMIGDLAWAGGDDFETLLKKATEALVSLRRRRLERKLDSIQIEIGQAEHNSNTERVLQLFQEKQEIKRRMLKLTA